MVERKMYMRDLYIEAINKFMESTQMKNYLVKNIDILQKWQIIDLICGARASLTDKYEMLKKLSEKETDEDKEERNSATKEGSLSTKASARCCYENGLSISKRSHLYRLYFISGTESQSSCS